MKQKSQRIKHVRVLKTKTPNAAFKDASARSKIKKKMKKEKFGEHGNEREEKRRRTTNS